MQEPYEFEDWLDNLDVQVLTDELKRDIIDNARDAYRKD